MRQAQEDEGGNGWKSEVGKKEGERKSECGMGKSERKKVEAWDEIPLRFLGLR